MQIQDLTKDLDAKTMTEVVGGDNGNSANNTIGQAQNILAPVGVLAGGPSNVSTHVSGTQNAATYNSQFGGDSYFAGLPCFPEEVKLG